MESSLKTSSETTQRAVAGLGEHLAKIEAVSKDYQQTVKAAQAESVKLFAEKVTSLSEGVEKSISASLELTQKTVSSLDSGIRSLNTVLEQLGSKQVVVQQVEKKGWFSRG
jgi:DNA anti-recombination protein RmuC